jgi:transposase
MLTITNQGVTRELLWEAFRGKHDLRLRERYHSIFLVFDGRSCPEIAQWLCRDGETVRSRVHAVTQAGLQGLERKVIPGRPA